MNVAIDAHMIGDNSGGNESYYTNILKEMTIPVNIHVFLIVKEGVDISFLDNKYKIIRFKSKNAFVRNFIELPIICKKNHIDILHTQYFIPFFIKTKVVCTIHDICFEHYKDIFTKKEYLRQKILIPYAARHSKYIYTVSKNAKKDIAKTYHINSKKIIVTYNSVDKEFKKMNESESKDIRLKYKLGDSKIVLTVGNLQPRKNIPRLIEAFIQYKKQYQDNTKLVIVGKRAWLFDDTFKAARNHKKDIIFTDYVEKSDLIKLYNEAQCFIYPSFFEGFGIPPLEAMACGTPVGVANATSLPEVVKDAGDYFNPFSVEEIKNVMYKLINDEEHRKELIEKGYERIKCFSWKKSADIIVNSYVKLLLGKKNEK